MAATLSLPISAKSMREIWMSMPDSIIPYLDKNRRIELVDFIDMKVKAEVKNLLDENTVMDTLTSVYTSVALNESSQLQMKLLPFAGGDSIICMVHTYKGPESESKVDFFSQDWKRLDNHVDLSQYVSSMIAKPDTMSQTNFEMLKSKIYPAMIRAALSLNDNNLTLELTSPLLFKDEKVQLKPILLQRKLKWDGKRFN